VISSSEQTHPRVGQPQLTYSQPMYGPSRIITPIEQEQLELQRERQYQSQQQQRIQHLHQQYQQLLQQYHAQQQNQQWISHTSANVSHYTPSIQYRQPMQAVQPRHPMSQMRQIQPHVQIPQPLRPPPSSSPHVLPPSSSPHLQDHTVLAQPQSQSMQIGRHQPPAVNMQQSVQFFQQPILTHHGQSTTAQQQETHAQQNIHVIQNEQSIPTSVQGQQTNSQQSNQALTQNIETKV